MKERTCNLINWTRAIIGVALMFIWGCSGWSFSTINVLLIKEVIVPILFFALFIPAGIFIIYKRFKT